MQLRPYQGEALDATQVNLMRGVNRQLIVLPTAAGKTIIFSQLPRKLRLRRPHKMIVVVQSDELCYQSMNKLKACNPTLRVGLEKAQYTSSPEDDIIVVSVQTLGGSKKDEHGNWVWSKRIKTIDPSNVRFVVVDEAHHITASNYHGILAYMGVFKGDERYNDPGRLLLGVTATPNRSDNKGLEAFFDEIVFSRDIRSMIRDGWLAPLEAHRVDTMVSLDGIDRRGGEYVTSQLEERINTPERNSLIVDKYIEMGESAPFLGFTCDIQHTIDLTEAFRARGIRCYGIASARPKDNQSEWLITKENDRKTAIQKYEDGEIDGLVSCQALLEGFDAPRAMVGLGAAPTASKLRFTQAVGRVLRPFPAPEVSEGWDGWRKRCAIWIDFVDNATKHSLITAPTLFGLKPEFNAKGKDLNAVVEEIERITAERPAVNASLYDNLDAIRSVSERIDMFAVPTINEEVKQHSKFAWITGVSEGTYQLSMPEKGMLTVKITALGEYEIAKHLTGVKTPLGTARTLAEALRLADRNVPAEAQILLKNDAEWRKLPVTDSQLGLLKRLCPHMRSPFASDQEFFTAIRGQYGRGEISLLLSQHDKRPATPQRGGQRQWQPRTRR